jgi:LysR family transcriptional regulator of abg operon
MKPNQLHAFVAVVEQMSIRAAARVLGLSQPAVTKIVRELEREVGAPLVERSVKGVRLTEFGKAFAPRARLLLADMQRARDEIAQIRDGATGSVSMAVSASFALTVLPAAFKDFHTRLPAVDVQFSEAVLPWMLARLRDGFLDFAVAHVVPGTLDAQFEAVELFPVQLVVGMRERHPLRARVRCTTCMPANGSCRATTTAGARPSRRSSHRWACRRRPASSRGSRSRWRWGWSVTWT